MSMSPFQLGGRPLRPQSACWPVLALMLAVGSFSPAVASAYPNTATIERMKKMSLDELLGLQVTTMSRKEELWWSAPGAIEVITGEDIRRSGAQNLPDAFRLSTGIDVAQPSARSWAISARGFNVLAANKISVLMDGRSLFTPFFSGVQWDAQDTLLEDIDRIEVVRGPVGALWGSFAVNGFVQIVTKSARDTQGTLVSTGGGTDTPHFISARHGGRLGRRAFYRAYVKYAKMNWTQLANGDRGQPPTDFLQGGFRTDTRLDDDTTATIQGDAYTNKGLPEDHPQGEISGANILARMRRSLGADSDFELLSYFDHTRRLIPATWLENRDTAALSMKYRRPAGAHDLLFGIDGHISRDHIAHLSVAAMDPPRRTTHSVSTYVQDTWSILPERVSVTLGAKAEHNAFSGFEYHPSARAAWTPSSRTTWWGAISRAGRPPVRIDHDLVFEFNGTTYVRSTDEFRSETVIAYETGWRQKLGETATIDVVTFYNKYDHLRTTEPLGAAALPVTFRNNLRARSMGVETTVMYQPIERLFFKLSHRYLDFDFIEAPNSRNITRGDTEANDPRHLLSLGLNATLPGNFEFDVMVRHVSERPNPASEGFTVADLRLGWSPSDQWDFSIIGRNLFHGLHQEIVTTNSFNDFIGPSATGKVTWRF